MDCVARQVASIGIEAVESGGRETTDQTGPPPAVAVAGRMPTSHIDSTE